MWLQFLSERRVVPPLGSVVLAWFLAAPASAGPVVAERRPHPDAPGVSRLAFTEESLQRGLNYQIGTPFDQFGAGLALVDLNADGHPDAVVLGATNGLVGVYQNNGSGSFINRSFTTGIGPVQAAGVSAADFDGDGLTDLYLSGWMTEGRLLRNNGNFVFTNVTAQAGVSMVGPAQGSAWSDVNGDGWLDLYVTSRTHTHGNPTRNKLFINNGDGTFAEAAGAMGVDCGEEPSLLAVFFDFDRDGWDDLYVGTDKGSGGVLHNHLFRNVAGVFTDITDQADAHAYVDCMGFAVGDVNFDGFFDVYMTNVDPGNKLFLHDGQGAFVDATAASGMAVYSYTWATVFADLNDDTHLETYVCGTHQPNRLFRGSATWPMQEVGQDAGVAVAGGSYCVAVGDVNGDHKLDLLVGEVSGRVKLFINRTETANRHVRFRVVGQGPNTLAVGAQLDLTAGGVTQARQIYAGSNYKAVNEFTVHFGLGRARTVDQLTVRWPGTGDTRVLTGVPVDREWTIYPDERLGDADGDGRRGPGDAAALIAAMTGPGVPIDPGREIFDMDGDFDIDADDLLRFARRAAEPAARPRAENHGDGPRATAPAADRPRPAYE